MIIYDCEIIKAIHTGRRTPIEGIEYCDGWNDHENMGISVICAYDYEERRYRVFCEDNFPAFQMLIARTDLVIGFNSLSFDNRLCLANGINVPEEKSYDLLVELWRGAGLGPKFEFPTHTGFGLDACASANLGRAKTGEGALAPVLWQRRQYGSVIDYCLCDVDLTRRLIDMVNAAGYLRDPRNRDSVLAVRRPSELQK